MSPSPFLPLPCHSHTPDSRHTPPPPPPRPPPTTAAAAAHGRHRRWQPQGRRPPLPQAGRGCGYRGAAGAEAGGGGRRLLPLSRWGAGAGAGAAGRRRPRRRRPTARPFPPPAPRPRSPRTCRGIVQGAAAAAAAGAGGGGREGGWGLHPMRRMNRGWGRRRWRGRGAVCGFVCGCVFGRR